MKLTLENTTDVVDLFPSGPDGAPVPVRIWRGTTERGIKVYAFIALVAVDKDDDQAAFLKELQERTVSLVVDE